MSCANCVLCRSRARNQARQFFCLRPLLFKRKNEMGGKAGVRSGASTVCSRRIVLILITGAALSAALIGRAAWLAGKQDKPEAVDFEELCIPGLRGSILDRNGKPLAWSERRLRLVWQLPQDGADAFAARERLLGIRELQKHLPAAEELPGLLGRKLVLIEALSGSLEPELLAHVESGELLLEGYFIRYMSGHRKSLGGLWWILSAALSWGVGAGKGV